MKMNQRTAPRLLTTAIGFGLAGLSLPGLTDTVDVKVYNSFFQNSTINIKVGDTVRWTWTDTGSVRHSTTSGTCAGGTCAKGGSDPWDSGEINQSGAVYTKSSAFSKAGEYPYYCTIHGSSMTGKIVVADAAPPPTPTTSCSPDDPINQNPVSAKIAKDAQPIAALQDFANGQGLVSPNWGTAAPRDSTHLFVIDTIGKIWAFNINDGSRNLVLDASSLLVKLGINAAGYDERGLLGIAFHPNYRRNGLFYTFTSEPYAANADFRLAHLNAGVTPNLVNVVSEWTMDAPRSAQPKASGNRRVLLRMEHPRFNHNGGALAFGRDGMLYIATGDGGGANDQDGGGGHTPVIGNGQDRATPLGKILRIDPTRRTSANGQYGIPRSNPFAKRGSRGGAAGCSDGICDEIWAYGFRNPYRMSFDSRTGKLWVGDVGQNKLEEVNVVRRGGNYGWAYKEGTLYFQVDKNTGAGFVSASNCRNVPTKGLIDPVAQYDHDEGIAIAGGWVYRGRAIRALRGHYVFGDYALQFAATDPSKAGRIFHIKGNGRLGQAQKTITELAVSGNQPVGISIYGFAQDAKGEIYVLGNTSGVPAPRDAQGNYVENGIIKKLVPASP